jgi:hypothetical protein
MEVVSQLVSTQPGIQQVDLSYQGITTNSLEDLVPHLASLKAMVSLNLSGNSISALPTDLADLVK